MLYHAGADADAVLPALERLEAVPGRVQRAAVLPNGAAVYVDYAHTPDALEAAIHDAHVLGISSDAPVKGSALSLTRTLKKVSRRKRGQSASSTA